MGDTAISWTDKTWNPAVGCTRISAGCDHCYIERQTPMRVARRTFDGPQIGATTGVTLHPERLNKPFTWHEPCKVFVNSMSDVFHEDIPDDFIAQMFAVMAATPHITYQILTKRHGRMRSLLANARSNDFVDRIAATLLTRGYFAGFAWPLPNVWLGVTTENQQWADRRIPALLETPAAVRFLSCEPLLGPINLNPYLAERIPVTNPLADAPDDALVNGMRRCVDEWYREDRIDWVIVGGESGPAKTKAGTARRPMDLEWLTGIVDQARATGAAVWTKQDGGFHSETRGQIPDDYWIHEFPNAAVPR